MDKSRATNTTKKLFAYGVISTILMVAMIIVATAFVSAATQSSGVGINAVVPSGSVVCGNSVVESGEACDNGGSNGGCPATCSGSCTFNNCGGVGNPAVCGNNITESGEECDLGSNNGSCPTNCSTSCSYNNCPPSTLEIKNLSVVKNCDQAIINWKTEYYVNNVYASDAVASTQAGYGINLDSENIGYGNSGINHSVTFSNLQLGQNYKYFAYSSSSIAFKKTTGTFVMTCTVTSPTITVVAENKGARINITYPVGLDVARLVIRKSNITAPLTMTDGTGFYDGLAENIVLDSSINLNTTYWYTVFICNSNNICSDGVFGSIQRTVPEVSGLSSAVSNKQIGLSWSNPVGDGVHDFIYSGIKLMRVSGNCASAGINDGQELVAGDLVHYDDNNLVNGQLYQYKIFVKNSYDEFSGGTCITAAPSASPEARCPSNINITSGDQEVAVSWTNPSDDPGVFQLNNVRWQRSVGCVNSENSGEAVYSGLGQNFIDSAVVNDQMYSYTMFIRYNQTLGVNCTCVTATPVGETKPKPEVSPIFSFATNNGALPLEIGRNNKIIVLPGYPITVSTPRYDFLKPVFLISARLLNENYILTINPEQDKYQTTFMAPTVVGTYDLHLVTTYSDGTVADDIWSLDVVPFGYVHVKRFGVDEGVPGIQIILGQGENIFQGFGAGNPQITDGSGFYGLMVPNGDYTLRVTTEGFKPYVVDIRVTNSIINQNIELTLDEDIFKKIIDIIRDPRPLWGLVKSGFLDNPLVQKINIQYAAPAIVALSTIATIGSIPWWDLIHYLQYLFTEPFAYIFRKKRKGWGVVYNSITKLPVDLAVVRLYDMTTKRLIRSAITDRRGRYNFLVEMGEYGLEISKPGFIFPSGIMKNVSEDKTYADLYHGGVIKVTAESGGVIVANIPIDQESVNVSDKQAIGSRKWLRLKRQISVMGLIFSVISFAISPMILTGLFIGLHLCLFLLFRRLAQKKKSKDWGVIYDKHSKKQLPNSVVRIFSPEYDKMLDVQVTDRQGRYGFLAGENVYYLTSSKDGYHEHKTDHIDLREQKDGKTVNRDMGLVPASGDNQANISANVMETPSPVESAGGKDTATPASEQIKGPIEDKKDIPNNLTIENNNKSEEKNLTNKPVSDDEPKNESKFG